MAISRIFFIALFSILLTGTAAFGDYIQGHVVLVDRGQGVVEIVLCESCPEEKSCAVESSEHLKTHGKNPARIRVVVAWIPRCLREGMMVFARGAYAEGDASRFEAVEVFPRKRMGGRDNTGVRSRFRHHRGRGGQQGQYDQ